MPVRLKVCCIASAAEARLAIDAGASLVGLVGAMPSGPGPIGDNAIAEIAQVVPPGVTSVLLTSETTRQGVAAHVDRTHPAAVQLVDRVEAGTIEYLREATPALRIIAVIHIEDERSIDAAVTLSSKVDALLLDSGRPTAAVRELGGTGRTHDWAISASIVDAVSVPVLLAGGITANNVAQAVETVRPWGIDLCSGVRRNGVLDRNELKRLSRNLFGPSLPKP